MVYYMILNIVPLYSKTLLFICFIYGSLYLLILKLLNLFLPAPLLPLVTKLW